MGDQISTMNIYRKLSAIQTELSAVAKNLTVGVGKSQYKAVGEADVLAAVKPLEAKYGIYSYPSKRDVCHTDVMVKQTTDRDGNIRESQNIFVRIETIYKFVNIDNPNESIEVTTYGDGVDPQDKAVGKAMTYADKYALLKAYKIITGEDPDQYGSEEGTFRRTAKAKPTAKLICDDCGAAITEAEYNWSTKKHGRPLCRTCQQNDDGLPF